MANYFGTSNDDSVTSSALNSVLYGYDGNDTLTGGAGNDTLYGGDGNDMLKGVSGRDVLVGGGGNDTYLVTGAGSTAYTLTIDDAVGDSDTLDASAAAVGVQINLNSGATSTIGQATVLLAGAGDTVQPLDVVLLQDLSSSFSDDVATVQTLVPQIVTAVKAIQSNARFGVASFVDKPTGYFGESGDYVYRTDLALTTDTTALQNTVNSLLIYSGYDGPEAQIEALMQAALRGTELGYADGALHVVVLMTDANYHLAGDGAAAGITTPNDADAVLEGTPAGTAEDYPDLAQVKAALQGSNVLPVFAVTSGQLATYQSLVEMLGFGAVVELSSDSNNLVSVITSGLEAVTQTQIENAIGSAFNDTLMGNALDNVMDGRAGQDTMTGGLGNDTYKIDRSSDVIVEASDAGTDTVESTITYSLIQNLENLTLTGTAAINGTGNSAGNQIVGNAAANTLTGGSGNDSLDGANGIDTAVYSGQRSHYTVTQSDRGYTVVDNAGADGSDVLVNVEFLRFSDKTVSLMPNNAPTGGVTVTGTATQGQTLKAANTLADADGLGTIRYQWLANGSTIAGATGATLALGAAQVGKTISVEASYTDGYGTPESVRSASTLAVAVAPADVGVVFTNTSALVTTEEGGSASFQVALRAAPRHDVVLTLSISDATEGKFQASGNTTTTVTFTAANWNTAQTVRVVGVDDGKLLDADIAYVIQTSVSSSDLRYDGMRSGAGLPIANITVTNIDNDAPDELTGDAGGIVTADLLHGGNGASDVYGYAGRDELYGGNGDDRVYGGYGDDVLYGDADNDELEGEQGNDKLSGGTGNDLLTGGTGKDTLLGGDGNDTLDGSSDADSMNGGNGADTYYVDNAGDIVSDSGTDTGKDTVYITAFLATGYTLGTGIDNAALQALANNAALTGNTGNNSLTGNASNNTLNGGAGNDSLSGGLGNDILYAGSGNDVVDGGDGNDLIIGGDGAGNDRYTGGAGTDTVKYTSATAAITVNLSTGSASGTNIGSDTLAQIENVIGGKGNDALIGSAVANQIDGYTGNDAMDGGAGNDTMLGGLGNDTYYVRQSGDRVTEAAGEGTDAVLSYLSSYTLTSNVEAGRIMSTGTASLTGNASGNTLYAGAGNNALNGGSGIDTASYAYATKAVKVSLALTTGQITGGSGTDTLTSIENLIGSNFNDTLTGSILGNSLSGGAGNDILSAGAGNDVLVGGLGADKLTGGTGADRFDFNFLAELGLSSTTRDTIVDFKTNQADKIDLQGVDANTALAGDQAFSYLGTAAFTGNATGKLRFDAVNHILYGSTDADTAAEFAIVLTGVNSLAGTSLVL